MNRENLVELLRYSSPYSILIVNYRNEIMELHCPFKVQVKEDVGDLIRGKILEVSMVKLSYELKTVYVIKNNPFYFWHFYILV